MSSAPRRRCRKRNHSSVNRAFAIRKPAPRSSRIPASTGCMLTAEFNHKDVGGCQRRSDLLDRSERGIEAAPASRFVGAGGADEHAIAARNQALRMIGGLAAHDAD